MIILLKKVRKLKFGWIAEVIRFGVCYKKKMRKDWTLRLITIC